MKRIGLMAIALIAASAGATPAAAVCVPLTLYFDWNSAVVSEESRAALERLAVNLAWKGPDLDHVVITGHTDSSGSAAANRAMAQRRAEAVRDVLLNYRVPSDRIVIRALGERVQRVATPVNSREPRNRRVDLLIQMSAEGQARQLAEGRPIC